MYMRTIKVNRGALLYLSTGRVHWLIADDDWPRTLLLGTDPYFGILTLLFEKHEVGTLFRALTPR